MANEENLKPFKKGVVQNPKGRPRKLVSHTIKELEEKGVKEVTKQEIIGVYLRIINLTIPELKKETDNVKNSVLLRTVGKAVLSGKGFDIIDRLLDRAIGKAESKIDITSKGKELRYTDKERKERLEKLVKKMKIA